MSLLGYLFPSVLRAICNPLTEAQPQGPDFHMDSTPLMGIPLPFLGLSSFNCTLGHPPPRLLERTNYIVVKFCALSHEGRGAHPVSELW